MLRVAVRTSVPKLQLPNTYRRGQLRLSQLRPFRVSTRVSSEADEYSEAGSGSANLEVRVTGLETETKEFKTGIFHRINALGTEMAHSFEKQLGSFANEQQKQFANFYSRSFFGVVGIAALLIGSAWILPLKERMSECHD